MNKKAQSEIITTVLIILLVIAAVVIVWQVISNTLSTTEEDISTGADCFDATVSVASVNSTSKNVTITRESGGPVDALKFVVYVNGAIVSTTPAGVDLANFETATVTLTTLAENDKVAVALNDVSGTTMCGSKSAEVLAKK